MSELIPGLFRAEYRKLVAVLCKRYGFGQIEVAEDLVGDTFLAAAESWARDGVPANPTAWLYSVAKNKALNYLKRDAVFEGKVLPELRRVGTEEELDFSEGNIMDSQLRMIFAVCHPCIPAESQIGLALRVLCGFSIEEIADAFLTNKETINKRLFRAKERLREEKVQLEMPGPQEIDVRVDAVLRTLYLLFNEGYYSTSPNRSFRKELCYEAIRLCQMLVDYSAANALLALMCFHASRFDARLDDKGELILYEQQDTSRWNQDWISKGGYFLQRASEGDRVTKYHLEAGIAYWNTQREDTREKWERILRLYDLLLQIEYSPMAALNRAYALSKVNGPAQAIAEAKRLKLEDNPYYTMLLEALRSRSPGQ
ncbi:MAG: sigma-70 family RNA polymerase sigma factor [Bacteroidetes bacterium]|nr:sigma-70 family RNA polymerase sigma factor [Bacteroidota bacterium]